MPAIQWTSIANWITSFFVSYSDLFTYIIGVALAGILIHSIITAVKGR